MSASKRRRARRNAWLIGGAVAISAVLLVLAVGAYPIALVNGKPIWASAFRSYLASAVAYKQAAHDTYAPSEPVPTLDKPTGVLTLDELIEQELINQGVKELVGDNATRLVNEKLSEISKEPDLPGASRALFQLDPGAFTNAVLKPQATREVLTGRVYLDGKTMQQWIDDARAHAKVRILSSSYRWNGKEVEAR